ncbi:MAG: hypothetical protein U1G07_09960 [Verrucomicrobiota bacterium]
MTARAVIEQIKALPPEEQAKVIDFVEEIKAVQQIRTMDPQKFDESTKRVSTATRS